MLRRIVGLACLGVLALGGGCVSWRVENRLHEAAKRYVYPQPVSQVWPVVKDYMTRKGWDYQTSPQHSELLTDWKENFLGNRVASSYVRYYVLARPYGAQGSEVRVYMQSMFTGGKGRPTTVEDALPELLLKGTLWQEGEAAGFRRVFRRDLNMEWELVQLIQPDDAEYLTALESPRK